MMNFAALASASRAVVRGRAPAPSGLPGYVSALPTWQWYGIPNTGMSSIAPDPLPPGGPTAKVTAWCALTLKRTGSVLIGGPRGGHGDYHGNELEAIALNVEVPGWEQLLGPTPDESIVNGTSVYLDYRRSSIHTYWATQFHQARNRMLIVSGGGPHGGSIDNAPDDWPWLTGEHPKVQDATYTESKPHMAFDLDTGAWLHPDTLAPIPAGVGGSSAMCCCDPVTNIIYAKAAGWGLLQKYDPATDVWTDAGNPGHVISAGSSVDPVRGQILIVGSTTGTAKVFDIASGVISSTTFGGLGADVLTAGVNPGVVFDEANDCWLVFVNTSPIQVYRVDPVTLEVTAPTIAGTAPAQRGNGIFNAVQYLPELRSVALQNSYTGNVQFMRTAL